MKFVFVILQSADARGKSAWLDDHLIADIEVAIDQGASYNALIHLPVRESIGRFKYVKEDEAETYYRNIAEELEEDVRELVSKGGNAND